MNPKVFISYARADLSLVEPIYQLLSSAGVAPWMDIHDIRPGEDWERSINFAIKKSDIFIAILTNNSVNRRGVIQKELKIALEKLDEFLPSDIFLIPIRLDDCEIPERLSRLQVLDWNNGKNRNKLIEAINNRQGNSGGKSSSTPESSKIFNAQIHMVCDRYLTASGQEQINLKNDVLLQGAPVITGFIDLLCSKAIHLKEEHIPTGDPELRILRMHEKMPPDIRYGLKPDALRLMVQHGGSDLEEYMRFLEEAILINVARDELEKFVKAASSVFVDLCKIADVFSVNNEVDVAFEVARPYRGWAMALILYYAAPLVRNRVLDWTDYGPRLAGQNDRSLSRAQVHFRLLWNFIGANSGNEQAKEFLKAMIERDPEHSFSQYEENTLNNSYLCFVLA